MEGLVGVKMTGHCALQLVMDPDHSFPIRSAPTSPQQADCENWAGGRLHTLDSGPCFLFSGSDE